MCSKFIACYGIATILDPVLLFIVDIAYHNYDCSTYDPNCTADYTSNSCLCFNGDFIKLFNRTVYEEGSGVTGVILVIIIYVVSIIVSTLLLYEYLVYVHKDARILDLWRRIKGGWLVLKILILAFTVIEFANVVSVLPFYSAPL